jgi:thiosulfate dehydrogenase
LSNGSAEKKGAARTKVKEATMSKRTLRRALLALALPSAALALAGTLRGDGPVPKAETVNVSLCDGQCTLAVPSLAPGDTRPRAESQNLADQMLQVWRKTQGETRWASWEADAATAHAETTQQAGASAEPGQPTKFTARDQMLWKREEKKWIDEGYKAYHNAAALGGTIGISCDMCHPDGSNTHPESFPKFQQQTKKVALLRDMINWCIENPLKGKPLAENDEKLRAVEAYILSTRKGVPLEPGKH